MVEAALAERLGRGEIRLEAREVGNKHAHDRVARLQVEREALAAKATDATNRSWPPPTSRPWQTTGTTTQRSTARCAERS